jgi:hypothetical protein
MRRMKLMINPWAEINLPNKEQANVRRADIVNPFDFFFGAEILLVITSLSISAIKT